MSKQEDIISGGRKNGHKQRQPGITPIEYWEKDFENEPFFDNVEKILEFPGITDMAGVFARGNFKSDKQRICALRLVYRLKKYGLNDRLEFMRQIIASGLGMSALGKMLQLQTGTNLIAPSVMREILGMRKLRRGENEDIQRGSDYRKRDDNQQINKGDIE